MSVQELQHVFLPIRTLFRSRSRSPRRVSATAEVLLQSLLQSVSFCSEHKLCIWKVSSQNPVPVGKRCQVRGPSHASVGVPFDKGHLDGSANGQSPCVLRSDLVVVKWALVPILHVGVVTENRLTKCSYSGQVQPPNGKALFQDGLGHFELAVRSSHAQSVLYLPSF